MSITVEVKGTIVSDDDKWIYEFIGYDAVCPRDIKEALLEANGQDVVIVISSGGGDVIAGNEMAYAISEYQGSTVADIAGFCGSAATIVACSAQKVRAYPTTMYMIHNVSSGASGDYRDMEHQSKVLQTANKAICMIYQQKTGLSEAELLKMMDEETWFDCATAKEKGFVDEIIGKDEVSKDMSFTINGSFGNIMSDEAKEKIRNLFEKRCRNPTPKAKENEILIAKEQLNLLRMKGDVL